MNLAAACPRIITVGILDARNPHIDSRCATSARKPVATETATKVRRLTWMPQRRQYLEMGAINSAASCPCIITVGILCARNPHIDSRCARGARKLVAT
jgi:hypothetical protein